MGTMEELRREIRKHAEKMSVVNETAAPQETGSMASLAGRIPEENREFAEHQMEVLVHRTVCSYRKTAQDSREQYPDEQLYECTLRMLSRLEKTLNGILGTVRTFLSAPEKGILHNTAVLQDMHELEYSFYCMSTVLCPGVPGNVIMREPVIPAVCRSDPEYGIITIELGTELPHIRTRHARLGGIYDKILEQTFMDQVKRLPDSELFERAYIVVEHHTDTARPDASVRDCDNYDTKHLVDLLSLYFLKNGDGPDRVRLLLSCVPDSRTYTRVHVVKPDAMEWFMREKGDFFTWGCQG